MPERRYDLLIFDWDGTLSDSIARIVESMRHAAAQLGLAQCDEAAIRGIIGLGLPEAIATLHEGLGESDIAEFRAHYSGHYLRLEAQPSPLFPGVREALAGFREQGYRLAVATGKSRAGLDRVLAGHAWLDYFDVSRCADETASKPDPLMLNEILAHCGVAPERALMIGDAAFDLQMAARAGMHSVAVGYGAQPLEYLRGFAPTLAVECFDQLVEWLATDPKDERWA